MEIVGVDVSAKCSIVEWRLILASNGLARYVLVDCA